MNFVLKEDAEGATLDAKFGSYFEGDGNSMTLAANVGLPLTDAGFANLSFEFKEADPTSRSAQRGDAQGLIDAGNSNVRQPAAQIWGAPEISGDFKLFGNFGLDLGNGSEAYAFGNWPNGRWKADSIIEIRTPGAACFGARSSKTVPRLSRWRT